MGSRFCIYSAPFQDKFVWVTHQKLHQAQITFHSFEADQELLFCDNQPQILHKEELRKSISPILEGTVNTEYSSSESKYTKTIEQLKQAMKMEKVSKVVLSRTDIIKGNLNAVKSLIALREEYPRAFCYLFQTENGETWIGATPEMLLWEGERNLQTMSLAGTLPIDQNWTQKEIEEQQAVTMYISEILDEFQCKYSVSEQEDLVIGEMKHLVQYFQIEKSDGLYKKLLDALHPTPAVAGFPKKKALDFIKKFEPFPRNWYTGYISIMTENKRQSLVNLRCGKLYSDGIALKVGGGITKDSIAKQEFQETQWKAASIAQHLVLN